MKSRHITEQDALKLAETSENHFFDRKSRDISGKQMQKIVVALANADGGDVYVGIADDKDEVDPKKRWNGFINLEDANGILQAIFELQPTIPLKYDILTSMYPGYVLHISVEKSATVHKTSDKTVYVRYSAQSLPINDPQRVVELTFAKGSVSFEDTSLPSVRAELIVDSLILKTFLEKLSPSTDPLDYAFNQNILDPDNFYPRIAGLLLFCENPSSSVPKKCGVKIVRYETKDDEPEREHLKNIFSLEGPIYNLIHDTVDKITEVMSSVTVWTPKGLGKANYPPEAIWEVVVNAIIHRDYSISDDVQIRIFDNRIEIQSPSQLPGYVKVENILDARFSRNPKIVRTLNWYPNPPNKDLGEGLNTAFQKMKEWGLKSPEIQEDGNYVVVTLPHAPLVRPADAIMDFLSVVKNVTNRQARDITGIKSENLVKNEFYKLRDQGYLERVPGLEGSKSAWRLTDRGRQYLKSERITDI